MKLERKDYEQAKLIAETEVRSNMIKKLVAEIIIKINPAGKIGKRIIKQAKADKELYDFNIKLSEKMAEVFAKKMKDCKEEKIDKETNIIAG